MRVFYVDENAYVGAHFVGRRRPIDELVRRYGFETLAVGQASGKIISEMLTQLGTSDLSEEEQRDAFMGIADN